MLIFIVLSIMEKEPLQIERLFFRFYLDKFCGQIEVKNLLDFIRKKTFGIWSSL